MIQGTVSDTGVPTIMLSIVGQAWPATIDTGFNGDLELPETLRETLNSQYIGEVVSIPSYPCYFTSLIKKEICAIIKNSRLNSTNKPT